MKKGYKHEEAAPYFDKLIFSKVHTNMNIVSNLSVEKTNFNFYFFSLIVRSETILCINSIILSICCR